MKIAKNVKIEIQQFVQLFNLFANINVAIRTNYNNERKLPEGHRRIDMPVDLHTAVIVMLFAVSVIVSKIVPPPLSPSLSISLSHLFHTLKFQFGT